MKLLAAIAILLCGFSMGACTENSGSIVFTGRLYLADGKTPLNRKVLIIPKLDLGRKEPPTFNSSFESDETGLYTIKVDIAQVTFPETETASIWVEGSLDVSGFAADQVSTLVDRSGLEEMLNTACHERLKFKSPTYQLQGKISFGPNVQNPTRKQDIVLELTPEKIQKADECLLAMTRGSIYGNQQVSP